MGRILSDYPEHEKLRAVAKESQTIGEFLDWMSFEKGIVRASLVEAHKVWVPMEKGNGFALRQNTDGEWGYWEHYSDKLWMDTTPIVNLLAEFFNIDQDVLEEEKRAMLNVLRKQNADA